METTIIRKDLTHLISYEKNIWKNYVKPRFTFAITFLIVAGLLLLDAIDNYTKTESLTGVTFSLGVAFLLFSIFIGVYPLLIRNAAIATTKKFIETKKDNNESIIITITGWGVSTKGLDTFAEFSWSFFHSYKVFDDSLLVVAKHHSFQSLFIKKDEMTTEKYGELLSFLERKFPNKKNINT